jgi:hypothetical protein
MEIPTMFNRRAALSSLASAGGGLGALMGGRAGMAPPAAEATPAPRPTASAVPVSDAGVEPVWLNGDPRSGTIVNGRQMFQAAIELARTEAIGLRHYMGRQVTWDDDVIYRWDGPVVIHNTYHLALVGPASSRPIEWAGPPNECALEMGSCQKCVVRNLSVTGYSDSERYLNVGLYLYQLRGGIVASRSNLFENCNFGSTNWGIRVPVQIGGALKDRNGTIVRDPTMDIMNDFNEFRNCIFSGYGNASGTEPSVGVYHEGTQAYDTLFWNCNANGSSPHARLASDLVAGSKRLSVTGGNPQPPFVTADVGKAIFIDGAGPDGKHLVTHIAAIIDPTTVEIADAASTTVKAGTNARWLSSRGAARGMHLANGNFHWLFGILGGHAEEDFHIGGWNSSQCTIGIVNGEMSSRFVRGGWGGSTARRALAIHGSRWSGDMLHQDGQAVIWQHPETLQVFGGRICEEMRRNCRLSLPPGGDQQFYGVQIASSLSDADLFPSGRPSCHVGLRIASADGARTYAGPFTLPGLTVG